MPRNRWVTNAAARTILLTSKVDGLFRRFDKLRSKLVLALASDAVLERFNDLAYGTSQTYVSHSDRFRSCLFPWEEEMIDRFFPVPPARVLVGGAGGGREAFALAERGYDVVAFEPSEKLVRAMAARCADDKRIAVYRASYETLPQLLPVTPGAAAGRLDRLDRFGASMLGWGSFSHLRTEPRRIQALQAFARVTSGPVLVGFLCSGTGDQARTSDHERSSTHGSGDRFTVSIGYYHESDRSEFESLVEKAGLEILHLNTDIRLANWAHAVLRAPL